MDPPISAAARALAAGDPLGALNRIALRADAPALALRGIAMAQIGDLVRARTLLRAAARIFGLKEPVAQARCVVAEAEVALAARDLGWPAARLDAARAILEAHGDGVNAAYARHLGVRRLLLVGQIEAADHAIAALDPVFFPPALRAAHELVAAGIALRRLQAQAARAALERAAQAADSARIPALAAEVETAFRILDAPAARLIEQGEVRTLLLDEVEALQKSDALVVDACRYVIRNARARVALARRPVLFTLARALAEVWPEDVSRDQLIALAFGGKHADESHRVRLRVEIARLRDLIRTLAGVRATRRGFVLAPHSAHEVLVLARPIEERHGAVLALLGDGEPWSSSALALALGASQRSVQRILDTLAAAGKVQPCGQGRARRWLTPPVPGSMAFLLLPGSLPSG